MISVIIPTLWKSEGFIDRLAQISNNELVGEIIFFSKQLEQFGSSNNMSDIENIAQSLSGDMAKIKYRLTFS